MRKTLLLLAVLAAPLAAQQQQGDVSNPAVTAAKSVWMVPHNFVVRALEQTPDSLLSFQPTPEVRTLGRQFAHIADGEFLFCALAMGEQPRPRAESVEATKSSKAELLEALKSSAAYCEKAYAQSDADALQPASFFGRQTNRLFLLGLNGAHDYEHYGNIVTYLRLKGITPPSSQR